MGHRLTNVPGSSVYVKGGVIAYANEIKQQSLGVRADTLATHGAVSEETAVEMATGVRRTLGSDLGLAITGIAGPDGGTRQAGRHGVLRAGGGRCRAPPPLPAVGQPRVGEAALLTSGARLGAPPSARAESNRVGHPAALRAGWGAQAPPESRSVGALLVGALSVVSRAGRVQDPPLQPSRPFLDKANRGGAHYAPVRPALSITLACAVGLLLPAHGAAQPLPAAEISHDTTQATGSSQPRTQVEPHIAVDPNNPQIVVAVFQQNRFPDGGSVAPGYATSHDGGQTWTTDDLPLLTVATGGVFERGTDPVVAFGPDGAVYAQTLVFGGPRSAIAVQRSDDGGLTFGAPVLAQDDPDGVFNDKNWMAVDTFAVSPHRGRIYSAWDQSNSSGQPILLRFSNDRGQTWSSLTIVSSVTAGGLGALPLVQPNGTLTIVYEDFTVADDEVAQTSHNGGASFDPPVKIGSFQGGSVPDIRSGALPAAAVDSTTGALYAVWQDRRFRSDTVRDVVISRSTSGGDSWNGLTRVNPDPPNSQLDHFTPAVVALNGRVYVAYRTRSVSGGLSPLVDMRYIVSADAGVTFSGERILGDPTDLHFAAQVTGNYCTNPPCYFLGDYMGIAASPQAVHPVWSRAFQDPGAPSARNESTWSSRIADGCGDGVSAAGEQCDGADATACPGVCRSDCSCPCTNDATDPKATITVKTKREAGSLSVNLVIPLAAYNGEAVSVRLDDGDSTPIAQQAVGALPTKGNRGKQWQYKVTPKGLQRVTLTDLSPRRPGMFRVIVKASKWFAANVADQGAANTRLTVTFGGQCFTHLATKKVD